MFFLNVWKINSILHKRKHVEPQKKRRRGKFYQDGPNMEHLGMDAMALCENEICPKAREHFVDDLGGPA